MVELMVRVQRLVCTTTMVHRCFVTFNISSTQSQRYTNPSS